jgi:phi13 family phage major tail protein
MAKIGLKNFLFGILTEAPDGTATYGVATKPAKAISCNVSISNNDAKLYADDALAESDTTFQSGTVTLGIDDEDSTVMATLLGHEITSGEIVRNANDIAPYVGLGRIVTKIVGGSYKYKVEFLKKVKFSEPSQEDNTKGESLEFGTSELEGTVAALADGSWSASKTFNTLAEAQTYLNGFFGSATAATVTYDVTTNGGSNAPAAVSTYVGATIPVDDGSGVTPPAGYHFIGWDTSAAATTPDVSGTYKVTKAATTLYAIFDED